jgi:branched-chain amino acid transport system permease protein
LASAPGAIAGGLLLGVLEALGAGYIGSGYKDVAAFIVLLVVLFVRPEGLFGAVRGERV